eukprot:Clim_evm5s196 gene=Clim_evmTU5s196
MHNSEEMRQSMSLLEVTGFKSADDSLLKPTWTQEVNVDDHTGRYVTVDYHAPQNGKRSEGPTLLMIHPTGFCRKINDPIIRSLQQKMPELDAVTVDIRGHGDSPSMGFDNSSGWAICAKDLTYVGDFLQGRMHGTVGKSFFAYGHSMGGCLALQTEIYRPGTFRAIVAADPITFPVDDSGVEHANTARARRANFESKEKFAELMSQKKLFRRIHPEVMLAYAAGGLKPLEGNKGVTLKCLPETEASFYLGGNGHETYKKLDEVGAPVVFLSGTHSNTHPHNIVDAIATRIRLVKHFSVEGSHFFPLENVDAVSEHIVDTIRQKPTHLPAGKL